MTIYYQLLQLLLSFSLDDVPTWARNVVYISIDFNVKIYLVSIKNIRLYGIHFQRILHIRLVITPPTPVKEHKS